MLQGSKTYLTILSALIFNVANDLGIGITSESTSTWINVTFLIGAGIFNYIGRKRLGDTPRLKK